MISSIFTGATGLKSQGEGISVIASNISNVNTVGYKQQSMQYADLMSQLVPASSNNITGLSQKGLGARTWDVRTFFDTNSFETSSNSTDIAIDGKGFFGVTKNGETHYTRAGNFRFSKDGVLQDPNHWNVLGRAIVNGVESQVTAPITIGSGGVMPASATTSITQISQLGGLQNKTNNPANPFFSLAAAYDGSSSKPLATSEYSFAQPITFYDANGNKHNATVYYDEAGTNAGQTAIEYVIAMDNPADDGSALAGTNAAGLLMAGTMTFSATKDLVNVTGFTPPASGDPTDLAGWMPASMVNGSPAFSATAKGAPAQTISLNMGLTLGNTTSAGLSSAADAATNPTAIFSKDLSATPQRVIASAYGDSAYGIFTNSNGYTEGTLRDVEVQPDGTITGSYSNGENMDLYRISLYRFVSEDGLRREGGNHFAATKESGPADEGKAGTENFGTTAGGFLEQSNVDYAKEFTQLIITQRGFQMNSKVITTSDAMLQKALELKR